MQLVDSESTNQQIITALRLVAKTKPKRNRRGAYCPVSDDPNQNRWLLPVHIGYADRREQSLVRRLHKMANEGLIERRKGTTRPRFRAKPVRKRS